MFKAIAAYFKAHNGKRALFGIILMVLGIVGWFLKLSDTVATIVIGYGALLLGLTTVDKQAGG